MKKYFIKNIKNILFLILIVLLDSLSIAGIPLITKYFT